MNNDIITNLDQLLLPHIGKSKKISDVKIKSLPPAGVGGVMLKLAITLKNIENDKEEKLYAVAKMLPATEFSRKMFKVEYSVLSETGFYLDVLPALLEFQKKYGFSTIKESSPLFYGARLNLDGSKNLTEDYVLLLEDLSVSGFKNIVRQEGFDLDGAKFILKNLAELHATSIALKLQNRPLFDERIKSICFGLYPWADIETMIRPVMTSIGRIIEKNDSIAHLREKVCADQPRPLPGVREPFATIAHCDMWVNNSMQTFENGKMTGNKFVDWAVCAYRSCVSDAMFFIWTSVNLGVIKSDLDNLLGWYHGELIGYLAKFGCDLEPFGYEKFLEEIKLESSYEIGHILFFIYICKNYFTLSEHEIDDAMNEESKIAEEVLANEGFKGTVWHFISECNKRGWLY